LLQKTKNIETTNVKAVKTSKPKQKNQAKTKQKQNQAKTKQKTSKKQAKNQAKPIKSQKLRVFEFPKLHSQFVFQNVKNKES
jgi:hypothetical protein